MTSGNVLTLKEAKEAFKHGHNYQLQKLLGVHEMTKHNEKGFVFRVWAPKAQAVWLVGDFNQWQADLSMEKDEYGIWSIFTTLPQIGEMYKFKIKQADGREIYKIDPFAVRFEPRPHDAAYIYPTEIKKWHDGLWRGRKKRSNYFERPLNIYEVHTSSWRHHADGTPYNFTDLKDELIPYLKKMGYTHVEFMPLMEHPLPASWGYQLIGYYALSEAYGTPEEFKDFVEACHLANIGVLVDWVPGHFCVNDDALAYYDGTPTFEYNDIDQANNRGWGALNFGLDKPEVQSFLISSALYWIEEFHIDGIRVDAVSNMLYLDYDNPNWTPNEQGTNLNLAGIAFLQELNRVVKFNHPDVLMIAEESSSSTKITGLIETGALGFDYKWNMGWMNDVLNFYQMDPLYRGEHLNMLTFSFMYRLAENYILPLSHDEVVHGKKSLMHKMWGDRYKQFAQLRNLYTYLIGHPGKKLLFMGSEWGQFLEWKYYEGLEWDDLKDPLNKKMQHFTATLNELYKTERALWECDDQPETLEVIDADNQAQTVLSFIRQGKRKKDFVIVILNLSPIEYQDFQIGVPYAGEYEEILNSELSEYGGTWKQGNPNVITQSAPFKDYQDVITTTVPALGALILKPKTIKYRRKRK